MTFSKSEYKKRLERARSKLGELDAILLSTDENLRYFTGVDSGKLLIWKDGAQFWLNEVYFDRAKDSPVKPDAPEKDSIKEFVYAQDFKDVGVDPVTLQVYNSIEPKYRKLLKPTDICEELRMIKSKDEIKVLEKAGLIASDAMDIAKTSTLIGMDELGLAAIIEYTIRRNESEKPPFSQGMLCLSGPNTKYPHAPPSKRKIKDGDMVVLDLGAVYRGYHSDMTRTIRVGKVTEDKNELVRLVQRLKVDAIDMIEVGGKISEIHKWIEAEMGKKGYKFAHLSGHGVGLNIHERPSLGPDGDAVFQNGMVFTIEPGIYTAKYGARSEDTIALVNGKTKILT